MTEQMVEFLPFSGWRYDLSQVGTLSEVLAPPVELIDDSIQRDLYRRHPCNAVRLVANREEPGDTSSVDRINRADDFLRLWRREGILLPEHDSAFYVVETSSSVEGLAISRWSVIGLLRLPNSADFETFAAEFELLDSLTERVALRRTCRACFSPIVALVENITGESGDSLNLPEVLESLVRLIPPVESIADDGTRHRVWPLSDREARNQITDRMAGVNLHFIGGVSEYAAAVQYRDEMAAAGMLTGPNDPAQFAMACVISVDDPGLMIIRPNEMEPDFLSASGRTELLTSLVKDVSGTEETRRDKSANAISESSGNRSQLSDTVYGLRLHPPVPSGLVFAVMGHSESEMLPGAGLATDPARVS